MSTEYRQKNIFCEKEEVTKNNKNKIPEILIKTGE